MQAGAIQITEVSPFADARSGGLELTDLLNDLDSLSTLLLEQLELARSATPDQQAAHMLDAFLLAAGMNQVTEDYVHRGFPSLEAVTRWASRRVPAFARSVERVRSTADVIRWRVERRSGAWQTSLKTLVGVLANSVMGSVDGDDGVHTLAARLQQGVSQFPRRLRREILRLPDCFRAFDQQPDDCRRLAQRFLDRWPDRDRQLLVVGVRTSGSYLAPLQAAYLSIAGCRRVDWMTLRPGQAWMPQERARILDLREHNGLALLIDDPPVTGGKLAASADELERLGLPSTSIVLLVPLHGDERVLPARLKPRQTVTLPWERWAINERLSDPSLLKTLRQTLVGRNVRTGHANRVLNVACVESLQALELEPIADVKARPLARSHLRTARRIDIRDENGFPSPLDVYIKGTGLGYFGRHSLAIARRLDGMVPEVYGWSDGLLFRALLSERARLTNTPDEKTATEIVQYVHARAGSLQTAEDKSLRLRRRHAAWEHLSELLASGFGHYQRLARIPLKRYASRVLSPARPAVIDGSMALPHWFSISAGAPAQRLVKADYDERAFSSWELFSYDPVTDLAMAAADWDLRAGDTARTDFGIVFKTEYQRLSGEFISDERWFLYRLLHLLSAHLHLQRLLRDGPGHLQRPDGSPALSAEIQEPEFLEDVAAGIEIGERALARTHNSYVASIYLGDLGSATGPVCSIEVEGLLESDWLRGGCLTSAGAMVLRSLIAHGFRPRLITNRSLPELRTRCVLYHAAGGVARDGELLVTDHLPIAHRETRLRARAQVVELLGHAPGGCGLCRPPRLSPDSKVIVTAINAHHQRGFGLVAGVVRLALAERAGQR